MQLSATLRSASGQPKNGNRGRRWFNVAKGFGLIFAEDGGADLRAFPRFRPDAFCCWLG